MKIGQFELTSFVEQKFKLDGGSMFGVVPRVMWEKLITPDSNNMIPLVTNLFVLKAHGKNIIFDIGLGDTLTEKDKKVYNTDGVTMMDEGLASVGLTPDNIDYILLTHLHTDHSAGAVKFVDGKMVPRFKNAKIMVERNEWDDAVNPNERTSAIYTPERLLILKDAHQIELIDANTELFPGIKAVHTGGHTSGHYSIEIESENKFAYYFSDLIPSSAHIKVSYIAALDLFPLDSMDIKRKKIPEIIEKQAVIAFAHDSNIPLGLVKKDGEKISVVRALPC